MQHPLSEREFKVPTLHHYPSHLRLKNTSSSIWRRNHSPIPCQHSLTQLLIIHVEHRRVDTIAPEAKHIIVTIAPEAKHIIVQQLLDIATYGVCDPKILREILPPSHILASCGLGGRVDLDIRNCFVQRELRSIRNFASQEQKKLRQACMAPGQARMEALPF